MAASRLVLASRSPRRARLLDRAGIGYRLGPFPDVDETPPPGLEPRRAVRALAERKVRAVAARIRADDVVLAADTLVCLGGHVLAKPADAADAARTLRKLSGRVHEVATGVAVARGDRLESGAAVARVRFRVLAESEIEAYVATGEPLDKAGAYGIQGGAAAFAAIEDGDLDTVVGLPLALVRDLLARLHASDLGSGTPPGR